MAVATIITIPGMRLITDSLESGTGNGCVPGEIARQRHLTQVLVAIFNGLGRQKFRSAGHVPGPQRWQSGVSPDIRSTMC
jgi:LysM repeat protein